MKLLRTYGWELRKLVRQKRTWVGLGAAVLYALAFVVALSVKKNAGIPSEIPLASQLTRSGVVLPLALIAFVTYLGAPIVSALVAGDIVSSEDSNNTLKTILSRSTERGTIYAAKVLAAATYGVALMLVLLATAVIGSIASWGLHGVTLVDGRSAGSAHALGLVALAYLSYLMPLTVLISVAFFLSTVTRNSAIAIVGTLLFVLAFEGIAALPGLEGAKPYLLPKQFDAWQALFGKTGVSIGRAAWTCTLYSLVPLATGWWIFSRRDVANG
jgi:ABC-2 type transport system permease protein